MRGKCAVLTMPLQIGQPVVCVQYMLSCYIEKAMRDALGAHTLGVQTVLLRTRRIFSDVNG